MTMGQACLKKGEEKDILAGGLWIYDNELAWVDEFCQDGGIVDVLDNRERFIARGYFNSKSKIQILKFLLFTIQLKMVN